MLGTAPPTLQIRPVLPFFSLASSWPGGYFGTRINHAIAHVVIQVRTLAGRLINQPGEFIT